VLVFKKEVFFVKKGWVTKTTTTHFFVFLFCLETFLISPHKKLSHHQKKKMADTSMDYSEYSENENSPMPVAKVRQSIRIER